MNERTLRALVEAGAVKRVRIVTDGARFHLEAVTPTMTVVATRACRRPGAVGMPRPAGSTHSASAPPNAMSAVGSPSSAA